MKRIVRKLIAAIAVVLAMGACLPAVHAAGIPALIVTCDSTNAEAGDAVVFTVTLTGGENSHIDGIGFHVQVTDGLEVDSSTVECASKFYMSSYRRSSGLFTAAAARNGIGVDDDTWKVLTVTCTVTEDASGEQRLFISKTINGVQDPKWSLFWLDESNNVRELECDLSGAVASITINGSQTSKEPDKEKNLTDEDDRDGAAVSDPGELGREEEEEQRAGDTRETSDAGGRDSSGSSSASDISPDDNDQNGSGAEDSGSTTGGDRNENDSSAGQVPLSEDKAVSPDGTAGGETAPTEESVNGVPVTNSAADAVQRAEQNEEKNDNGKDGGSVGPSYDSLELPEEGNGRKNLRIAAGTAAVLVIAVIVATILKVRKR